MVSISATPPDWPTVCRRRHVSRPNLATWHQLEFTVPDTDKNVIEAKQLPSSINHSTTHSINQSINHPTMSQVALIFGSGANVGVATAKAFSAKGYKVAAVSRSNKTHDEANVDLQITGDLAKTESVSEAFQQTINKLGHPSVVIYNGKQVAALDPNKTRKRSIILTGSAAILTPYSPEDPASVSVEAFENDLRVNTVSVFAAVQQAVKSFDAVGSGTFIYTGNFLNDKKTIPGPFLTLGVGKSASSYLIQTASEAYGAKGYG